MQVKVGSLREHQSKMTVILIKRGNLDTDTYRGKVM